MEVATLTRPECLDLLRQASIGRVGASVDALPVVLPVHFALFEDSVLFRTTPGTKLDAATVGAVVAFQADAYEPSGDAGWSVLLQGIATVVSEQDDVRAIAVPIKPWASLDRELHLVRVEATNVTGRRFRTVSQGPQVEPPGPHPL